MNKEIDQTDILSQAIEQRQAELFKGLLSGKGNDNIFHKSIEIVNEETLQKETEKRIKKIGKPKRPIRNGMGKIPNIGARFLWTADMDERLITGYNTLKPEDYRRGCHLAGFFDKVAEYVGYGVTKEQCKIRYFAINPEFKDRKSGPWTEEETEQLKIYAQQEVENPTGVYQKGQRTMNWMHISKELNRQNTQCKRKWLLLQSFNLKKGPFTSDEDAVITQRVMEWGDKGNGLWKSIEKEIGRSDSTIRQRWDLRLSQRLGLNRIHELMNRAEEEDDDDSVMT